MNTPKDKVYRLIQTMTPAEKRYFKRHYGFAENNLTQLYDFLNSQPEYDEEKVKASFPEKFAKNLKVYKVQLQDLILKSLVSYRNKRNVLAKIRIGLEEVDILMEKHLYEYAGERLNKVKEICIKYETFTYLIEVIRMEFRLHYVQIDKIGLSSVPLFEEWENALSHLRSEYDFSKLSNDLHDQSRKTDHIQSSNTQEAYLRDLLKAQPVNHPPRSLSFQARLSRNVTLTTIYKMLGQTAQEEKYRHANVDLFEEQPWFRDIMPFTYLSVMRNYLNYNLRMQNEETTHAIIEAAEAFIQTHSSYQMLLIYFYYGELQCKYETGRFVSILEESAGKTIKCIEEAKIEHDRIALMCYLVLALTAIILRDFQTAFQYLQMAQRIPADTRAYFDELIFILELINHFEAGDDFLIENQLAALARRKKHPPEEGECLFQELCQLFKQLIKDRNKGRQSAELLMSRLPRFKGERIHLLFRYYLLDNWLAALVEEKNWMDAAEERTAQYGRSTSGAK